MGSLHPISEDDDDEEDDDDDDNWGERRKVLFTDYLVLGLEYPERVSIDMLSWTWYSKYSAARGLIKTPLRDFPGTQTTMIFGSILSFWDPLPNITLSLPPPLNQGGKTLQ